MSFPNDKGFGQYCETALWSSLLLDHPDYGPDDNWPTASEHFDPLDIRQADIDRAFVDYCTLRDQAWAALRAAGVDPDEIDETDFAHDLWLTREGHGCGFWDGNWSEPAAAILTKIAECAGPGGYFYWIDAETVGWDL